MKATNYTIIIIASLIFTSCNFNFGKKGNGNVITQNRSISENFSEVKASAGLDVYLTQGNENKISVETDENLQEYIKTEINGGRLHITTTENIGWSKAKKVYVTFIELNIIEATSGSNLVGNSVIKSENLKLKSTSGADMKLEVFSKEVTASTSSGSDMDLSGKASTLIAKASSGSELNAKELLVINCTADASSGSEIKVTVKEKLDAKASSGADVNYYGNPTSVNSNNSSSGSVRKK